MRAVAFSAIDLLAALRIAVERFGRHNAERADIRDDTCELLLRHPCARHFGTGNSEGDNARQSLVVSSPRQVRLREVGAFAAVALRAVTDGAMRLKQLPASVQLRLSLRGAGETDS